jgi:hypothetical protein
MSILSNHYPEILDELNELAAEEAASNFRKPRKPRPKPERRIRIIEQPTDATDGWAAVEISVGKKTDAYLIHTIPTDFEGVTALEVEKLDANLEVIGQYHVCLSDQPEDRRCECKGFLRHGHCKHVDGLGALASVGRL